MSRISCCLGSVLLASAVAHANPASVVPSPGLTPAQAILDYSYELDTATIAREKAGDPTAPADGGVPVGRELEFQQFRHVLTPRVEVGIVNDTWLSAALPITINQARELKLASGVTRDTSTTVRDGLLPMNGFDADDPGVSPAGDMMFKGPGRAGLDQVHLGIGVAPMNQRRDDTKPTWKMGAELRLAIGSIMAFSANNPGDNSAVGRGVHELRLWTTIDRQFSRFEGWFGMYYQVPLTTTDGSLFTEDLGFGTTNARPPQQGGMHFGVETYLMKDEVTGNRISLDLGARVEGHFEGRDYTEMWEVLAFAGDAGNPTIPPRLVLDSDPTDPAENTLNHPGISNVENYLKTAATFGVRAVLGPHVRFAATVDLSWRTDHAITFADAGVDLNTCAAGQTQNCETDNNDVVNQGTREVNPLHAPLIDQVGHRYISRNGFGLTIGVNGQFLF